MDILICAKRTKIIATRTSSSLKIWHKCFGGRGGARWGSLQRSPDPRWILGRKDGEKKRRGRNVRKEGEGRRDKKEGRGIGERRRRGPY